MGGWGWKLILNPKCRIHGSLGGAYFLKERRGYQCIKNINTSGFLEIFLVYAVIMEVKSNVKPEIGQNLFRIGGELPRPHTQLHLLVAEFSEGVHYLRN